MYCSQKWKYIFFYFYTTVFSPEPVDVLRGTGESAAAGVEPFLTSGTLVGGGALMSRFDFKRHMYLYR